MTRPFHLSIAVPNLSDARSFYSGVLGCEIGRDEGSWFDVLFFGHQLTIHQATEHHAAVTIDHFGPIVDKETWSALADALGSRSSAFVMEPRVSEEKTPRESGKFVVKDPAGNLLEFKYYRKPDGVS
jgi:extradiol dioxygenase family protein